MPTRDDALAARVEQRIGRIADLLDETRSWVEQADDASLRSRLRDELDHRIGSRLSPRMALLVGAALRSRAAPEALLAAVCAAD